MLTSHIFNDGFTEAGGFAENSIFPYTPATTDVKDGS